MSSLLQTSGHQGAILAAAQPYYHPQHSHQSPTTANQDVQPDRPIGYGAFGVVCPMIFVSVMCICQE
ncbi:Serine/threonine kinase NLK [Polyplax serrata]|uniref:Serine/threonine kinase NLK n=1 Tax=Polyplax serrata TaxID=468196 RepID=A0ABR1BCB9_POLSC